MTLQRGGHAGHLTTLNHTQSHTDANAEGDQNHSSRNQATASKGQIRSRQADENQNYGYAKDG